MANGNAIRGTRVGSGPPNWTGQAEEVPRHTVSYWCANAHETVTAFAATAAPPPLWDCPRCGLPAGQDRANPPDRPQCEPYKSHLAYVKERRSEADAAAILAEALDRLRQRRGA